MVELSEPEILLAQGLTSAFTRLLAGVTESLDSVAEGDWAVIEQPLIEFAVGIVQRFAREAARPSTSTAQTNLLQRVYQTIERRLDEPDLTLARLAQAEGISERYLQKLFETSGDTFSHYLRERRLQRSRADLANPTISGVSVTEIAYRSGFNDAAHFSRAFRDRFGLAPRAFRQREVEQHAPRSRDQSHRGWPEEALSQLHSKEPGFVVAATVAEPAGHRRPTSSRPRRHHLPVSAQTVHWGYFSRSLEPQIKVRSGDVVTVETLTQHASDDPARMISGDSGAESVFRWTATEKGVDRRGAGPMDASVYGRGAGEGFGVHICTGPIAVEGAEPGDVLEVRILDIAPRPSGSGAFAGRFFGSSAAAWWGYHYSELLTEPRPRESVTIFEIFPDAEVPHARAVHSYRWEPQVDPFGIVHKTYDYPGVPVDPASVQLRHDVLEDIRIPLRPHFGVIGVAPRQSDLVDSVPPAYFGGNIDNWRLGKGSTVYLPVSVAGALLSVGDPHAAQGDGELSGTAIECSMTGTLKLRLHKRDEVSGTALADLTYPLIETEREWVLTGFSHPNYLAEFGAKGPSEVYAKASLDLAMKDAFRKTRRFLMNTCGLSEDETITLISAAVDFGITQVVDGNWGVHAVIPKSLCPTSLTIMPREVP